MKRVTVVAVILSHDSCVELYEKYKACCPQGYDQRPYTGGSLDLAFTPDSPELKEYLSDLEALGGSPGLFSHVIYTAKEIREAPFFQINADYPFELEGTRSEEYGTKHIGGCPECHRGEKTVGDVFVDRKFLKKCEFGWLEPELFVSERVLKVFEEAGITGYTVGPQIKDYKGREIPPNYVLEVNSILPPMAETVWLNPTRSICETCGKPHTVYLYSDAQYEREKLKNAKDINFSCELVNNYHLPVLIVSAKLRNLLKEHKVRVYRPQPLTIID